VAEKNRLYRCLDRVLTHKQELFVWLKQKWADLFAADFEVLLYDLTSTYFEGQMKQNPKTKRGYSRDGRADCLQLVIALVITPDGFPLASGPRHVQALRIGLAQVTKRWSGELRDCNEFHSPRPSPLAVTNLKGSVHCICLSLSERQ
jgi:hypothetical protein